MRSIEWRNRNQIERCEREVEKDSVNEHQLKNRGAGCERGNSASNEIDQHDHRHTEKSDDHISRYSGQRNDDVAFLEISVVARINRNRFRTAERNSGGEERDQRKNDRQERIDVLRRIPGESAELVRGGIAIFEGRVAVRIFMRNHREEEYRSDQNELLELVQFVSRESLIRRG